MRNAALVLLSVLLLLTLFSGCAGLQTKSETERFSELLGIDVSKAAVEKQFDTHGGFTGDGMTFVLYRFEDVAPDGAFAESENWHELPLSDVGKQIVSSLILDKDYHDLIPQVEHGYWFFRDRHSESTDPGDESGIFARYSFNFDFAVYDADTNRLYFAVFDT